MFREAIRRGGPLAETAKGFIDKGQLVPDEITVQIVRLWLDAHGRERGFIFDGFPRTLPQAQAFDRLLAERELRLTMVLLLDVSEAEILDFCRARLSTYKLPRAVEFRSDLPTSGAGKLLRRALRGEVSR